MDANSLRNPLQRSGVQDVSAYWNEEQVKKARQQNGELGVSPYAGGSIEHFNILKHEICYTMRGPSKGEGTTMKVQSALNLLGAEAASAYRNHPEFEEMVRQAVRNSIQPTSVAVGDLIAGSKGSVKLGLAVALAGTNTIFGGNLGPRRAVPGDIIEVDVPPPGKAGLAMNKGHHRSKDVPATKYKLQPRPLDEYIAGRNMCFHIRMILENPAKWRYAMIDQHQGTNAWMTAAKHIIDSYLAGLVLGLQTLLERGWFAPTKAFTDMLTQEDRAIVTKANPSTRDKGEAANAVAVNVAEMMRIIPQTHRTMLASNESKKEVELTRAIIAQKVFHGERVTGNLKGKLNAAFEFGFLPKDGSILSKHQGRFDTGVVRHNDSYGALLEVQLNHVARAIGGYSYAVNDQRRFIIGKSITGEGANLHLTLGVNQ